MADIPATYAGAWMRWALYLHDHPAAAEPTFDVTNGDDPRVQIPDEFSGAGADANGEVIPTRYVVCTLDPCDGSRPETAWKDIPHTETKYGKTTAFPKTPDNWRKVCAGALGRALKEAGYPDDSRELAGVIAWRRRDIELRALASGAPVPAVTETGDDVAQAGRAERVDEHPDHVAPETTDEPEEAEVVGEVVAWSDEAGPALRPIFDALPREAQDQVRGFCEGRNMGPYWLLTNGPLRKAVAFARSLAPKASPPADSSPPQPETPDSPSQAPEAPESPQEAAGDEATGLGDEDLCGGCGGALPLVTENPKATEVAVVGATGKMYHARCVPFPDPDPPQTIGDLKAAVAAIKP